MTDSEEELSYYRAVEDVFSALRGVPHMLSPKDFQLLRSWWRDQVPLAAVSSGISEVMARRRERGDDDPVVSLSYCRHAVGRHAKRLAEMHVGDGEPEPASSDREGLERDPSSLAETLRAAAAAHREGMPQVAEAIAGIADQLEHSADMPAALLEEHLFSLEAVLLDHCWRGLSEEARQAIDRSSREAAAASGAADDARERTRRAIRDRELRRLLELPRLELE